MWHPDIEMNMLNWNTATEPVVHCDCACCQCLPQKPYEDIKVRTTETSPGPGELNIISSGICKPNEIPSVWHQYFQNPCCCGKIHYHQQNTSVAGNIHSESNNGRHLDTQFQGRRNGLDNEELYTPAPKHNGLRTWMYNCPPPCMDVDVQTMPGVLPDGLYRHAPEQLGIGTWMDVDVDVQTMTEVQKNGAPETNKTRMVCEECPLLLPEGWPTTTSDATTTCVEAGVQTLADERLLPFPKGLPSAVEAGVQTLLDERPLPLPKAPNTNKRRRETRVHYEERPSILPRDKIFQNPSRHGLNDQSDHRHYRCLQNVVSETYDPAHVKERYNKRRQDNVLTNTRSLSKLYSNGLRKVVSSDVSVVRIVPLVTENRVSWTNIGDQDIDNERFQIKSKDASKSTLILIDGKCVVNIGDADGTQLKNKSCRKNKPSKTSFKNNILKKKSNRILTLFKLRKK